MSARSKPQVPILEISPKYGTAELDTIYWLPYLEVPDLGFDFLAAYDLNGDAGG